MAREGEDEPARIRGEVPVERGSGGGMRWWRFAVGRIDGQGWRLDRYVHALVPSISRSLLQRWIEEGRCTADGAVARAAQRVKPGMRVELVVPLPPPLADRAAPPLRILHEDRGFLVVDKPAGLLAHQAGKTMSGTLINQLQDWAAATGREPAEVRLVNRIDRDTSGLVLVSLDLATHVRLAEALDSGALRKEYRAICHGVPAAGHGHWRDPIAEAGEESIAMRIAPDGKPSHTEYEVLAAAPAGFALLRVLLHTGRQHQIRIHAAHNGHPLAGDWVYGEPCAELAGQALHAALLAFPHPDSGRPLQVEAPLPAPLASLWERIAAGGAPTRVPLSEEQRSKLGLGAADEGPRLPAWLSRADYEALRREIEGGMEATG